MNWDPFQREALAELGHRLYRVRGTEASPGPDPVAPIDPAPQARPARTAAPPPPKAAVDPLLRALSPYYVQNIEVAEPTLEEIFLSFYGGNGQTQKERAS